MARDNKVKNTKAYIIFNTVLKKMDELKVCRIRLKLGIPEWGFGEDVEAYNMWFDGLEKEMDEYYDIDIAPEQKKGNRYSLYRKLIEEIKIRDPRMTSFHKLISEYVTLGYPTEETFFKTNTTGCNLVLVTDDNKSQIKNGVYIRVGEYSLPEDVKNFVANNTKMLNFAAAEVYGVPKLNKRLKTQDFYTNNMIYMVSKYSTKSLKDMILKETGDKNLIISNEKKFLARTLLRKVFDVDIDEQFYVSQLRKEKKERFGKS